MTLSQLLSQAAQVDENLYMSGDLYLCTDPEEETDWLMVSRDFENWECYPPSALVEDI